MINKCLNAKAFHDLQWVLCCLIRHRGLSNNLLSAFAKVLYFFLVWKVRRKEQRGSNSYFCCFLFVRHSHKWYVMKLDLKMTIHAAKPTTNWSLVMTVNMKNTFASFALIKTATKPLKELTQSWYLWSEWKCALFYGLTVHDRTVLLEDSGTFPFSVGAHATKAKASVRWYRNYFDS